MAGDKEALSALRAREAKQPLKGNTVSAEGVTSNQPLTSVQQDNITKKGTVIYSTDKTAIRDDGERIQLSRNADMKGLQVALRMVISKYGKNLTVTGTDKFKRQIVETAVQSGISVTFKDSILEQYKKSLLTKQEKANEREKQRRTNRRSNDGIGSDRRGVTAVRRVTVSADGRRGAINKPNLGRVREQPPSENKNRLRGMSELSVVRFSSRSEVLLQSDVHSNLEYQRTKSDNRLRRRIRGPRGIETVTAKKTKLPKVGQQPPPESKNCLRDVSDIKTLHMEGKSKVSKERTALADTGQIAINKYIKEREDKRKNITSILKHRQYSSSDAGLVIYRGQRSIDNHTLALVDSNNEILVMEVNKSFASRLKKVSVGEKVFLTEDGKIQTKGRSR